MQKRIWRSEIYAAISGEFLCGVEEDAGVCCRDDTMQGRYE